MFRQAIRGLVALSFACVLVLPGLASAAETGRISFKSGAVTIERAGQSLPALEGTALQSGDVIVTGDDGRVRMTMADDAQYALRPGSRFKIEEYGYAKGDTKVEKRSFYELIQGGFRGISGLIKGDLNTYRVKMPVATMGIRGTDKVAIQCGLCPAGLQPGGHTLVKSGEVLLQNNAGSVVVPAGKYAFAPDANTLPVVGDPPAAMLALAAEFEADEFGGFNVEFEFEIERRVSPN